MNTRFSVAVHILIILQRQAGEPIASGIIAESVNTDASLIRRLLSQLAKAGLTGSQMGTGGGALLARPAETITLLDVYDAVNDGACVIPIHPAPNPRCPIGRNIEGLLDPRIDAAEEALRAELARTTIADLARDLAERERREKAGAAAS